MSPYPHVLLKVSISKGSGYQDPVTWKFRPVVPLLEPFLAHTGTIRVILPEGPTEQLALCKA